MKTYPVRSKDGTRTFAFEIENIYIPPSTAARLLSKVEGVSNVELRKIFSKWQEVHVKFRYRGQPYMVWEPFGDSSRYWVGPMEEANDADDINPLELAFNHYRPPCYRSLLGDFLTLRFVTRFLGKSR